MTCFFPHLRRCKKSRRLARGGLFLKLCLLPARLDQSRSRFDLVVNQSLPTTAKPIRPHPRRNIAVGSERRESALPSEAAAPIIGTQHMINNMVRVRFFIFSVSHIIVMN